MTAALVHPGADPKCRTCHGLGLHVVAQDGVAVAVACTCRAPVCPVCKGAGYVQEGVGFRAPVKRCACQEVAARAKRFGLARIPGRYADASLAAAGTSEAATLVKAIEQSILRKWSPQGNNQGMVFHGKVGRGKTHLAVALLRELILRHGASGRFVEFTHLLTDLKMSFEGKGASADIVAPLYEVDVLVIDELGKGRCTEFEQTVLDDLVSRRYNAGKAILATTNFDPDKPPTGSAIANLSSRHASADASDRVETPSLLDRIDERVFSRLKEMCRFVHVAGEDRRRLRAG